MNTNLSLGQRLMADTPNFFKIAGHIGTFLILAAAGLAFGHVAPAITTAVGALGTGIAVVAPFAVKDIATVAAAGSPILGAVELLPQLLDQFDQVKSAIGASAAQPVTISPDSISTIAGLQPTASTIASALQAALTPVPAMVAVPKMEAAIESPNLSPGPDNVVQMPGTGGQPIINGLPG